MSGGAYIEGNTLVLGDSSYLEHHGIKGQRWGVRRFQNKDGSLTREYQNWIKRFEVFCMDHPIDEFLESEHKGSMNRIEFLKGAKEYLAHRQELKEKYANS